MSREPLPIDDVLPELIAVLRSHPSAVLRAPTGAGKTTRVPPALDRAGFLGPGRVVMVEPRRLAARAAARRIAAEDGSRLGGRVGYHVRFDRKAGRDTRLLVVTPGILLNLLHDDPFLESVACVVFDEFHERGLESDLALGLCRLVQQTVRPGMRLLAMSATLAAQRVADYLGGCPVVASEGRLFPVEIEYRPRRGGEPLAASVAAAAVDLLDRTPGDLLAFLPGMAEIRQAVAELEARTAGRDLLLLPLHGDLPPERQDRALLPQAKRKVVLATNVAETSVTVEGVTGIIDGGLAREMRFDPATGLDRLEVVPISRAAADQRAGRAGRTAPGLCVRLWEEAGHRSRPEQTTPEVRRVDLSGALLRLLDFGETDLTAFPWVEAPSAEAVERSMALLDRLDAVEGYSLTEIGRRLARLPVHPRLGRLLLEGHTLGDLESAALAAAVLSERDPFDRSPDAPAADATFSDVLDRVEALREFERHGRTDFRIGRVNRAVAGVALRARDQLLAGFDGADPAGSDADPDAVCRALLAAFPDRLARRREADGRRGLMAGGRGVRLAPRSGVTGPELFLCIDLDAGGSESWVRLASGVRREWLPAGRVQAEIETTFDQATKQVVARKVIRFDDLVLEEKTAGLPDEAEVARVLAGAAAGRLAEVLPPEGSPADDFLRRVAWLRGEMTRSGLPEFSDDELRELLTWLCPGKRSFAELRAADWLPMLKGRLTPAQARLLDQEAPERIEVPSGNRVALRYEPCRPPVLAVRIQELFGLADTPRLAGGRVKILFHLLGPNMRPQQVTDDLAGFWKHTYQQVRKELRGRYPKHPWPENPLTATAVGRPKRP